MTFAEFEATIKRICRMSELIIYKEIQPTSHDSTTSTDEQRRARDDVVHDLINWAKQKATL